MLHLRPTFRLFPATAAMMVAALVCSCQPAETVGNGEGTGGGAAGMGGSGGSGGTSSGAAGNGTGGAAGSSAGAGGRGGSGDATGTAGTGGAGASASAARLRAATPARPQAPAARGPRRQRRWRRRAPARAAAEARRAPLAARPARRAQAEGQQPLAKFVGNITPAARFVRTSSCTGTRSRPRTRQVGLRRGHARSDELVGARHDVQVRQGPQHPVQAAQLRVGQPAAELDRAACHRPNRREEVEEWIRLYCERYPDTELIDVVNEPPPHTTPSYTAALGGAGTSGYDWIVTGVQVGAPVLPERDPDPERLQQHRVLGRQQPHHRHRQPHQGRRRAHRRRRRASTRLRQPVGQHGADVHRQDRVADGVAGLHQRIRHRTSPTTTPAKNVMQSQFTMFWNDPNVKGITIWGYIVGSTWQANTGLMTSSGTMRPAMTWLLDFLGR